MTITLNALQKQRRDTASNWTSNNPTLLDGELGYETDTKKFKIGDGSTAWQSLDYLPIPDTNRLLAGNLTVGGNFQVNGTTTTVNTSVLDVEDINITLGKVSTPSDTTADGGGITLKGATDKTINWVNSTDSWTLSEHLDIATGKVFKINNTEVLSATTLGSSVVSSSLTSVGTITSGVWNGTAIAKSNLASLDIVNADVNASAAIAGSKIDPDFGSQNITTTGNIEIDSDSAELKLGDGQDFRLLHNGTDNKIIAQNGELLVQCNTYSIRNENGQTTYATIDSNGQVGIATTSGGGKLAILSNSSSYEGLELQTPSGDATGEFHIGVHQSGSTAGRSIVFKRGGADGMDTESMRIDSSGNVGIGTSAPTDYNNLAENLVVATSSDTGITVASGTSSQGSLFFADGTSGSAMVEGFVAYEHNNNALKLGTSNDERMRINSTGQVAIGTTTTNTNDRLTVLDPGNVFISIRSDAAADDTIQSLDFGVGTADRSSTNLTAVIKAKIHSQSGGTLKSDLLFSTNAGNSITERMRIDSSGHVLFNCTSLPSTSVAGAGFEKNGSQAILFSSSGSSTASSNHAEFLNGNGVVGTINTNGSATSFNTSSDYRLKENATTISDGITRLKTLKPYRFNFKADASTTVDGFFAHEVTAVPEAISGTKDEVDSDNNPVYQGIDQSKLVPLLTAALQEAIAKIEVLETKVAALEAA